MSSWRLLQGFELMSYLLCRNDNMCFRRGGQRPAHRAELHPLTTQSQETMTDLSYPPLQRLDYNSMTMVKGESKHDATSATDQQWKRENPFSDRKTINRDNNRNGCHADLSKGGSRNRTRSRARGHKEVTARDDGKKQSQPERSSKRKRSAERSPISRKERSNDYSRERKRIARSDETRSVRRNNLRDDEAHDDLQRKDVSNSYEKGKKTRHHTDQRDIKELPRKNSERCDVKLEPKEKVKYSSPKRKPNAAFTTEVSGTDGQKKKTPKKRDRISRSAAENGKEKLKAQEPPNGPTPSKSAEMEAEDGEIFDTLEAEIAARGIVETACEVKNYNKLQQASPEGARERDTIAAPFEKSVNQIDECVGSRTAKDEEPFPKPLMCGIDSTAEMIKVEKMEIKIEMEVETDIKYSPPSDNGVPILGELATVGVHQTGIESNESNEGIHPPDFNEMIAAVSNHSIEDGKSNTERQTESIVEMVSRTPTIDLMHATGNIETRSNSAPTAERSGNGTHNPPAESEQHSPNVSLSKSVKNISTTSTDYQIVEEEENQEIVIYVTRKKVKKPKKEKRRDKDKRTSRVEANNQ